MTATRAPHPIPLSIRAEDLLIADGYREDERRPRMTPELEALHAHAMQEARRRQILRDGFKASIEQLALSTQCQEEKISSQQE